MIRRALCRLFGHRWEPGWIGAIAYREHCQRCGVTRLIDA